jgi:hypothetical protein
MSEDGARMEERSQMHLLTEISEITTKHVFIASVWLSKGLQKEPEFTLF